MNLPLAPIDLKNDGDLVKVNMAHSGVDGPKYSNQHYIAVVDYEMDHTKPKNAGHVGHTESGKGILSTIEVPDILYEIDDKNKSKEGFADKNQFPPKFVNTRENIRMENNIITRFYFGSVTVIGLYLFYRMLLKSR